MAQTDDFYTDASGGIFKQMFKKTVRQSVIKSGEVEFGEPQKIETRTRQHQNNDSGNIFPLIEGDEIVGFVYECSCGEVAKILFEYDQDVERVAS